MPQGTAQAPLKYTDIKDAIGSGIRSITPASLAFMLGSQIPAASTTGIDPRRLPFNNISPQLRDQRQYSLANPTQNNPFSVFGAAGQLQRNANK
jgi:hypothetical protein